MAYHGVTTKQLSVKINQPIQWYIRFIPYKTLVAKAKTDLLERFQELSMVKSKDLLGLTGYIHGGCSPIGMKKFFKTTFDNSAKGFEKILFSAGKIGYQVELSLEDLSKVITYNTFDLCE